jgi:hypothetical protein
MPLCQRSSDADPRCKARNAAEPHSNTARFRERGATVAAAESARFRLAYANLG